MNHRKHALVATQYCLVVAAALFVVMSALPAQYLTEALYVPNAPPPGVPNYTSIAADLNQNGYADLVYFELQYSAFVVDLDPAVSGVGPYSLQALGIGWTGGGGATECVAGDVNGDGFVDLVFNRYAGLSISLGNGNGTFVPPTAFFNGLQGLVKRLTMLDVNNDGAQDLLCLYMQQGGGWFQTLCILNQYPTWIIVPNSGALFNIPTSGSGLFLGDFDGDGNVDNAFQDILVPLGGPIVTRIFWGNGMGQFPWNNVTPSGFPATTPPIIRAVADMNGDGISDLICGSPITVGGVATEQLQIFLGSSSRILTPAGTFPVPPGNMNLAPTYAADFNGDGLGDVLCVSSTTLPGAFGDFNVTMALGLPGGQLHQVGMVTPHSPTILGIYPLILVGDFDGDASLDLFSTPRGCPAYFFRNRTMTGTGCAGTGAAIPGLLAPDALVGNSVFAVNIYGALINAPAVLAIAVGLNTSPFNTCGVYLDLSGPAVYLPGTTDLWGNIAWPVPIPNNPLLRGLTAYAQAAVLDPLGPNLGGLNLALSPARTIIIW